MKQKNREEKSLFQIINTTGKKGFEAEKGHRGKAVWTGERDTTRYSAKGVKFLTGKEKKLRETGKILKKRIRMQSEKISALKFGEKIVGEKRY